MNRDPIDVWYERFPCSYSKGEIRVSAARSARENSGRRIVRADGQRRRFRERDVVGNLATGAVVYVTEWSSNGDQGLGEAMISAKRFTPMFCAYEYQEQPSETSVGDPIWGLLNTNAWSAFASAAQ